MAESPAAVPTERSIPPISRTRAYPRATRPTKDACRATTVRLYCERKFGEAIDSAAARSRRATRIPLASHFRNRLRSRAQELGDDGVEAMRSLTVRFLDL
jgi:hypothetical protein